MSRRKARLGREAVQVACPGLDMGARAIDVLPSDSSG
jgi:hypothetical protein